MLCILTWIDLKTLGCTSTLQWYAGAEQQLPPLDRVCAHPLAPSPPGLLPPFPLPTRPIPRLHREWGFQNSSVISSKPFTLSCFLFYIPTCSQDLKVLMSWLTSCLWILLIPLVWHLAPFPQATCASCPPCPWPSTPGGPTHVPRCWQPQKPSQRHPAWLALTSYLSLL